MIAMKRSLIFAALCLFTALPAAEKSPLVLSTTGQPQTLQAGDVLRLPITGPFYTALVPTATADRDINLPDATTTLVGTDVTQTLTNKSLTAPTITGTWTAAGATVTDLGIVTTVDINGGTIDGAAIGGASRSTGAFSAATVLTSGGLSQLTIGDSVASGYSGLVMHSNGAQKNWLIGVQYNVNGAFEITPSTAAGGTTFSVPVVTITDTAFTLASGINLAMSGASTATFGTGLTTIGGSVTINGGSSPTGTATVVIRQVADSSVGGLRLENTDNSGAFRIWKGAGAAATTITDQGVDTISFAGGTVIVGNAAIATTATSGFLYIPTCAGTPTGTPTTYTGRAPLVIDSTNNKLYFYSGGAWRDAGP